MIIKSHIRGGYRAAADYLKDIGANESTRLVEISEPGAKDLDEAFRNMWAVGKTTRAKKPLHHVSINPYKDERLTGEQVLLICARLEQKYGYAKGAHQRVIVEHVKDGRQHFHVIWNRVSLVTGRPVWPGHHWNKSKQAAREMEAELGLRRPSPRRTRARKSTSRHGKARARASMRRIFDPTKPIRPILPIRRRPCVTQPAPRRRSLPIRRRRDRKKDAQCNPPVLINQQMSREELIAWAWENNRFDILAQFGIYASPDP